MAWEGDGLIPWHVVFISRHLITMTVYGLRGRWADPVTRSADVSSSGVWQVADSSPTCCRYLQNTKKNNIHDQRHSGMALWGTSRCGTYNPSLILAQYSSNHFSYTPNSRPPHSHVKHRTYECSPSEKPTPIPLILVLKNNPFSCKTRTFSL